MRFIRPSPPSRLPYWHLGTPRATAVIGRPAQAELLADAFESGDASHIAQALGVVARVRGTTATAREAGVTREALYKALSARGDPRLSTLVGVMKALGVKLSATSI